MPSAASACAASAAPGKSAVPASALPRPASGAVRFRIPAMDCSAEEADIRRALDGVPGIRSLHFQLVARTLTIDAPDQALQAAVETIGRAGYPMQPLAAGAAGGPGAAGAGAHQGHGPAPHAHDHGHGHDHDHGHGHGHDHDHGAAPGPGGLPAGWQRLAGALALAGVAEALGFAAPAGLAWTLAGMAVALAAIGLAGLQVYQKGLAALRRGRLNINALMAVAVTGAFLIGQWPEAAMVMALYSIAELIEALAVDRARNAIRGLMALAPEAADMRQADGGWATVPLAEVPLDATVRVRPGGRIPLDGIVTAGASAVNQAPVTGESLTVDKAVGDSVFGGTLSQSGEIEVRVSAAASDSTLARIIHAVEQAQGARAPTQRFIDRFAAVYTPAVFALALAVALLAPLLLGWGWADALYRALVLLVIACPCALVISTPVTLVSGLTAAARRGILIKGGSHLEGARRLKAVALDKTGTLTQGKPLLVHWQAWDGADPAQAGRIAAGLAARSDHPVSAAIAQGLAAENPATAAPVEAFGALAGQGVQGRIAGQLHVLGNHRLIEARGQCSPALEALLARGT